ncbi:MAG: ribonuclease PH, partial [Candidatus Syntrophonatronum acetioxidans]
AVSVGIVEGQELIDLDFDEDFSAQVDMNLVMTGEGKLVEIQGTAEGEPFSQDLMLNLLLLGQEGIKELVQFQKESLGPAVPLIGG